MDGPKILIANYEQIHGHVDLLNSLNFHVRIFDEAHYLQNPKAKRTQACMKLTATRTILLTGTPLLNHINGLWTLLNMVHPKKYPRYYHFINRYAVFGGFEGKQIVGVKNEKELKESLQELMLRRLSDDVLNLKEPRWISRRVDLHPEQQKLYDQLDEEGVIDIDSLNSIEVENALTRFLRHKQICSTTATLLGLKFDYSHKLDLAAADALELVENGRPVVTFTQFRPTIEAFKARLHGLGIETWELHGDIPQEYRTEVIKQWGESKKIGVLICQTVVAGIGLNMTAARDCQFLDKLFTPGLNRQAWKRLVRIGASETEAVNIYEYIVRGTVEQRIEEILRIKEKLAKDVVEVENFKKELLKLLAKKEAA
jgi:SNF2 family DNA or RNA helicase